MMEAYYINYSGKSSDILQVGAHLRLVLFAPMTDHRLPLLKPLEGFEPPPLSKHWYLAVCQPLTPEPLFCKRLGISVYRRFRALHMLKPL
jgi:hypothetical protein